MSYSYLQFCWKIQLFHIMRGYKNHSEIQVLENKLQDKFVDPLIRLCSFSLKTESTLGFMRWQSYTTLRRILVTELEIINAAIFS